MVVENGKVSLHFIDHPILNHMMEAIVGVALREAGLLKTLANYHTEEKEEILVLKVLTLVVVVMVIVKVGMKEV